MTDSFELPDDYNDYLQLPDEDDLITSSESHTDSVLPMPGVVTSSKFESKILKSQYIEYSPNTITIFGAYLFKKFPKLKELNSNLIHKNSQVLALENPSEKQETVASLFEVPANTLTTIEIHNMLLEMYDTGMLTMGMTPSDKQTHILKKIFEDPEFKDVLVNLKSETKPQIDYEVYFPIDDSEQAIFDIDDFYNQIENYSAKKNPELTNSDYAMQLVHLFNAFKEFLIVEYLNSYNNPVTESLIHNRRFYIMQKPNGKFKANIELENWSGMEQLDFDNTSETLNTKVANFEIRSLRDVLSDMVFESTNGKITDEQLAKRLNQLLESMLPIAKVLDFMNSEDVTMYSEHKEEIDGVVTNVADKISAFKLPIADLDVKLENIFVRTLKNVVKEDPQAEFTEDADFNEADTQEVKSPTIKDRSLNNVETGEYYDNLVLGDLGIAYANYSRIDKGAEGTQGYASPEVHFSNLTNDLTKADVYGYAVTLYSLILGYDVTSSDPARVFPMDNANGLNLRPSFMFQDENGDVQNPETNILFDIDDILSISKRLRITMLQAQSVVHVLAQGMSFDPKYRYGRCTDLIKDILSAIKS